MIPIDPDTNLSRGLMIVSTNQELHDKWFSYNTIDCCTLLEDNNNNNNNTQSNDNNIPNNINLSLSDSSTLSNLQFQLQQSPEILTIIENKKNPLQVLCEHNCVNCSCSGDISST